VGASDPVLGVDVMQDLRSMIRGCPEPWVIEGAGHFLQEWGQPIAEAAVRDLGPA
jgi:pimeloyl-ACP methyl ester carboxylesterase